MIVYGPIVDDQTRCVHYSTDQDIVAVKFACCLRYYPCYLCHEQTADHIAGQWSSDQRSQLAILCGVCSEELSIEKYLRVNACPACLAPFNPRCHLHSRLYFQD